MGTPGYNASVMSSSDTNDSAKPKDTNYTRKRRSSVRVFKCQESLTDQLISRDNNFQAVYHAGVIQVLLFSLAIFIWDSYSAKKVYLDLTSLYTDLISFHHLCTFLLLEAFLFTVTLQVHPCFKLWHILYQQSSGSRRKWLSLLFIVLYVLYVLGSACVVCWIVFTHSFPTFLTIAASIEQLRLSMMSYSFIRENAYKVLYPWHKDDDTGPAVWYAGQMEPRVGSFSQFAYFLFTPTLLYRDNYPRNKGNINYKNIMVYFMQFLVAVWCMSVIYRKFTFPKMFSLEQLIMCYLMCVYAAFFMIILLHIGVLHGYMNFVSEIVRFADRRFYEDWWTSTSFMSFYRKWNTLVHSWIYSYLYCDLKALFGKAKPAIFMTILISAIVHEYVLAVGLGFASPILLFLFAGPGVIFVMRPSRNERLSNFFVLLSLTIGIANLFFYYQVEIAARLYCPQEWSFYRFFKPRVFECLWHQLNSSSSTML